MSRGALDAAGITDQRLRTAYTASRRLHAEHGRTYYLATRLLPAARRPYVHALYGFARYADDIVDTGGSPGQAAERLDALRAAVLSGTPGTLGAEPVVLALRDTIERFALPTDYLADFLDSMRSDLTVTEYPTYADLAGYTWGSAAVIGLLLLPILGTVTDLSTAAPYAADLGVAFQLTNFLRDVGEDWRLGRTYLPLEDLTRFGVTRAELGSGVRDERVRALLAYQIARTRELYRRAEPGIALLDPASRPCISAAFRLYGEILVEIERADYDVVARRATVPRWRRAAIAAPAVRAALRARAAGSSQLAGPRRAL